MLPTKQHPHYDNVLLLDEEDQPLATISNKRALWYLQRELAAKVAPPSGYPDCIRLKFTPKGHPVHGYSFLTRINQCVVCGTTERLTLHHVIPRIISREFPPESKEHSSAWCVLLCLEHHLAAEADLRPHISGSKLWDKVKPRHVSSGSRSATALIHLHNSGRLLVLSATHPERVRELCVRAGLTQLPATAPEWAKLEAHKLQQFQQGRGTFAREFLQEHGGITGAKELFRQVFLQLKPAHLPPGSLLDNKSLNY